MKPRYSIQTQYAEKINDPGTWHELISYKDKKSAFSDFKALSKLGHCWKYRVIQILDDVTILKNA